MDRPRRPESNPDAMKETAPHAKDVGPHRAVDESLVGGSTRRSPTEILARAQSGRRIIQEFRPLSESLEAELSGVYFQNRGTLVFASDRIPFEINNDGNFSMRAAGVLFRSLVESERQGSLAPKIAVLELGVGSGLFARYVLDHFRGLCLKHSKDYYDRLVYFVTDTSERMLTDIQRLGTFAGHPGHYRLVPVDALQPEVDLAKAMGDGGEGLPRFRAAFLNYVLDVLPSTALRFDDDGVKQLYIRTCLARDIDFAEYGLSAEEIAKRAASDDPLVRRELVDFYPLFALEYNYRPINLDDLPYGDFAREYNRASSPYLMFNYGALQCLDKVGRLLEDGGLIIINDYGQTKPEQSKEEHVHQRYSGSIACEINFPLLESFCRQRCEFQTVLPDGDMDLIHSRMVCLNVPEQVQKEFTDSYGKQAFEQVQLPTQQARALREQGRIEQALVSYERALTAQPYSWPLADEVTKFLMTALKDFEAALQMTMHALSLNPSYSANLWCNLGDCRKALKMPEIKPCYRQALEIDPENARAHFGLGLVAITERDYGTALHEFAEALARDKSGEFRDRILEEQKDVLGLLNQRWEKERQNLANRVNRVIDVDASTISKPPVRDDKSGLDVGQEPSAPKT